MADARGGYRQPNNPAPVSGPGSLSQRTDGGATDGMQPAQTQGPKYMPGLGYGKGGENMANQQAAALAGNPVPSMPAPVPLSAPTMRPNEPITSGINMGPGPGTEAMQLPNKAPTIIDTLRHLVNFDPSGDTEMIYNQMLNSGNV